LGAIQSATPSSWAIFYDGKPVMDDVLSVLQRDDEGPRWRQPILVARGIAGQCTGGAGPSVRCG
jgi:hypothetical protein